MGGNAMDLKKALTYVAIGFLFTLINLNITIGTITINFTPDFVGWILFFLAFDKLGSYVEGKTYLKWMALVLAIISTAIWVLELAKQQLDISILSTIVSLVSLIYLFIFLGVLEKIAADQGSNTASTLHMLKYVNAFLDVAFVVVAVITGFNQNNQVLIMVTALLGALALVSAVFICLTLFRLRKDVVTKINE